MWTPTIKRMPRQRIEVAAKTRSPQALTLQLLPRDADEIALDRVAKDAYDPAIGPDVAKASRAPCR